MLLYLVRQLRDRAASAWEVRVPGTLLHRRTYLIPHYELLSLSWNLSSYLSYLGPVGPRVLLPLLNHCFAFSVALAAPVNTFLCDTFGGSPLESVMVLELQVSSAYTVAHNGTVPMLFTELYGCKCPESVTQWSMVALSSETGLDSQFAQPHPVSSGTTSTGQLTEAQNGKFDPRVAARQALRLLPLPNHVQLLERLNWRPVLVPSVSPWTLRRTATETIHKVSAKALVCHWAALCGTIS